MRTQTEIRDSIRQSFVSNPTLITAYGLNASLSFSEQFSPVSIEAVLIDVFALGAWLIEQMFSQHQKDVEAALATMKPHGLRWYQAKVLRFRQGQALMPDSDGYDDTGLSPQDIALMEVVKHASAIEMSDGSATPLLRIKVAGSLAGGLVALSDTIVDAIQYYMTAIKDAGVKLLVTSNDPDYYRATISVQYNPLVLDGQGLDLGTGQELARIGVENYLRSLPFNGEFSPQALQDSLQSTNGIVLSYISESQAKYANLPWVDTGARYIPDSGHMKVYLPADLIITYTPYTPNAI